MKFRDLREFLDMLEANGDLVRIKEEIDPNLEMTEIADRTLRGGGPALLFENPKGYDVPLHLTHHRRQLCLTRQQSHEPGRNSPQHAILSRDAG